jgi:Transposase DDE domain
LIRNALGITLDANAHYLIIGGHPMWQQEFTWFFSLFHREFRKNNPVAFEVIMVLALAHLFGIYNPKQLADFLDIPHQSLYTYLKSWSLYHLKEMLIHFMVKQAAEQLSGMLDKSDATRSRAGLSLSIDNSVIVRLGKCLRCTWSWYSGHCKKVVQGQDLLGIVLTINQVALPVHLLFCSKQGPGSTDKPTQLITMLTQLKDAFRRYDIDLTQMPLTLDSWFVSQPLRHELYGLGFEKIIIAGKGNYTFTINNRKQKASIWKKALTLEPPKWGLEVPSRRLYAYNPTFGSLILLFFQKSTTRSYYLMNFSQRSMRGAEIWHIWKQHHQIECFWKLLKSVLQVRAMHLHGDGLYAGLLIKVLAYLLAMRIRTHRAFSKCSLTQIMRKLSRDHDLRELLAEHFHGPCLGTQ